VIVCWFKFNVEFFVQCLCIYFCLTRVSLFLLELVLCIFVHFPLIVVSLVVSTGAVDCFERLVSLLSEM